MVKSRGFTLMETLVVISLALVLTGTVAWVMVRSYRTYQVTYIKNELERRTRLSLDAIKLDTQKASAVLDSYGSHTSGSNTLILQLPRLDSDNRPVEGQFVHLIYRRQPSSPNQIERIQIIDAVESTRLLNGKISTLAFSYQDDNGYPISGIWSSAARVTISLATQDSLAGKTYQSSYSTSATLRNR